MESDNVDTISERLERALDADRASELDTIESRACTSDRFDGVQYYLYGSFIDARSVIDVFAETEGWAIENLFHSTDTGSPYLGVFAARLPEQNHPAFV